MDRLLTLYNEYGQSPWLDNLKRGYITSGELAGLVLIVHDSPAGNGASQENRAAEIGLDGSTGIVQSSGLPAGKGQQ